MGSKAAGGEQNSRAAAVARLVGGALEDFRGGFAQGRQCYFAATRRNTSRTRKGEVANAGRRIPFVSCLSSWR